MFYIVAGHREDHKNTQVIFMAGVVTKKKGFFSVLILSKKKTNQQRTPHLDPQWLGQSHYNIEMDG